MFGRFLCLGLVCLFGARAPHAPQDKTSELIAELRRARDKADPKLIEALAGTPTREALDGLIEIDALMDTVFMRREIVRMLSRFDATPDLAQIAMKKLMDTATAAREPELREAALDTLGRCVQSGKPYLALIVSSPAQDAVRERAMENHVQLSDKSDLDWYKTLCHPSAASGKAEQEREKPAKRKHGADEAPAAKKVHSLDSIRLLAFDVIRSELSAEDLASAMKDKHAPIRTSAFAELDRRAPKNLRELATAAFTNLSEDPRVRIAAAGILVKLDGAKAAHELIKVGTNVDSPMELRRGLASILARLRDAAIDKTLVRELAAKGRTDAKLFLLHAVRDLRDEQLDTTLAKLVFEKDVDVVIATCAVLAARGDKSALPALAKLCEKEKNPLIVRAAWEAVVALRHGEPDWLAKLLELAASPDPELRNLALQALGQSGDKTHTAKLVEALDDPRWSTRLFALESLETLRDKETLSAIIARMAKEEGRILEEFAGTLWRLTGQPFGDDAGHWSEWWRAHGNAFELLTEADLERVESSEQDRELKQSTRVWGRTRGEWRLKQKTPLRENEFFGIRIASHRVLFLIDVSLSMQDALAGDYAGKSGEVRIDVAKQEMLKCLAGLSHGAFFNILVFCGDVEQWRKGALAAADAKNRADAAAFVGKLLLCGGTNLYDTICRAFEDPEVDTLYIMSDGEPTSGSEIEPVVIRERVQRMNAHRGIEINTIAIGGSFQILKWLAEDSVGTHVKFE